MYNKNITITSVFSAWFAVVGVSVLLVAVPLGWWPKDPYGLIKWTMVGVVAVGIAAVWFASSIIRGRLTIRRNAINVPLLILIGWSSMSLFIGSHGYYVWRRLSEILFMALIYLVLVCSIGERKWRRAFLVVASLIGLSAISIMGIAQYSGFYSTDSPWGSSLGPRVYATMLNPNYLAGYILSLFFVPLSFFVFGRRRWLTIAFLTAVIICASLGLLFTVSWGAWLGWLVAIVVLITLAVRGARTQAGLKRLVAIVLVFIVLAAAFLYLNRSTVASDFSGMKFRILYWRASLAMIRERPLIGFGLNGFWPNIPGYLTMIIASDYPAGLPEDGSAVTVYDGIYAHNEYIGIWLELGIVGLVIFIWFMWGFFSQAVRNLRGGAGSMETAINVGAICGVAAMLVQSIFSYPLRLPATAVSFAVLLALVGSGRRTGTAVLRLALPLPIKIFLALVVIGCAVPLVPRLVYPLLGEGIYVEARRASFVGDWGKVADKCREALRYSITEPEIFDLVGDAHKKLGSPHEAISALYAKLELKPYDVNAYHKLGKIYEQLGMEDKAAGCFQRAVELERHDSAEGRVHLAEILARRSHGDDALALLESGLLWYNRNWMLRNSLGIAYAARGEWDRAGKEFIASREYGGRAVPKYNLRVLEEHRRSTGERGHVENEFIGPREYDWIEERIGNGRFALKRGHYREAQEEFKRALERYPDYVPALSNMGLYLMKTQGLEGAQTLWERARALDPEHSIDFNL